MNGLIFNFCKLKSVNCKIKKEPFKNIFLEEKIEEYIGDKPASIIEFFYYRGKNRKLHWR